MYRDWSRMTSALTSAGSRAVALARFALTDSITSIVFAPGLAADVEYDRRHAV